MTAPVSVRVGLGNQCIARHHASQLLRCRPPPAKPTPDRKPVDSRECEDTDRYERPPPLPGTHGQALSA